MARVYQVGTGDLMAAQGASGEGIGAEDVMIAATALVHGLLLVTRNRRHFDRIKGLVVEAR